MSGAISRQGVRHLLKIAFGGGAIFVDLLVASFVSARLDTKASAQVAEAQSLMGASRLGVEGLFRHEKQ